MFVFPAGRTVSYSSSGRMRPRPSRKTIWQPCGDVKEGKSKKQMKSVVVRAAFADQTAMIDTRVPRKLLK
jgi:hypothetical protein